MIDYPARKEQLTKARIYLEMAIERELEGRHNLAKLYLQKSIFHERQARAIERNPL